MDRKKYVFEASDDVKKVIAMGVTRGGAIWTDTMDVENFEELNSDYINEHFGDLQDEAYQKGLEEGKKATWGLVADASSAEYQRGLDDAWEAARKIGLAGQMKLEEMGFEFNSNELFYNPSWYVVMKYTAAEAIEKIKAYEEKKKDDDEIKVGDEVIYIEHKFIVFATETEEHYASLFDVNGRHASASQSKCKKTGRHFDIPKILEEMRT